MLNRTILMGRLANDPKLNTTNDGTHVTTFRLAVEQKYVKKGEERKVNFIDIVCWRQLADFVCNNFKKSSLILIEGQLQSRTYQTKDGITRHTVEVIADNVSFTGERCDTPLSEDNDKT